MHMHIINPLFLENRKSITYEIANIDTRDIILSRQRTTKVLIGLRGMGGGAFFFFFFFIFWFLICEKKIKWHKRSTKK